MSTRREIDDVTGVETTGHVWDDDIRELNKPLPRWWLLTFYASIIWAAGYWVAYPAWPTISSYTEGVLGYSQRRTVADEVQKAALAQAALREQMAKLPVADILKSPELARFGEAAGRMAFAENCAPCHGRGAQGATGYPSLRDDEWIWGGTPDDILKTIAFGIRSGHASTRASQMPRFGLDALLSGGQIDDVAEYTLSLTAPPADKAAAARGAVVFKEQCAACHGDAGKGKADQGAPDLTDRIWLYGGSKAEVVTSIRTGRGGMMPAWDGRLDPFLQKALAVYVHSLGGGK